ncbi:DUF6893 family small protein [Micromonospora sp. MS34]
MRKLLVLVAGAAVVGLFWKELPALRRYMKIAKM